MLDDECRAFPGSVETPSGVAQQIAKTHLADDVVEDGVAFLFRRHRGNKHNHRENELEEHKCTSHVLQGASRKNSRLAALTDFEWQTCHDSNGTLSLLTNDELLRM